MNHMGMSKVDLASLPMFASSYNEHCPFLSEVNESQQHAAKAAKMDELLKEKDFACPHEECCMFQGPQRSEPGFFDTVNGEVDEDEDLDTADMPALQTVTAENGLVRSAMNFLIPPSLKRQRLRMFELNWSRSWIS